jgi:hypothetical protein
MLFGTITLTNANLPTNVIMHAENASSPGVPKRCTNGDHAMLFMSAESSTQNQTLRMREAERNNAHVNRKQQGAYSPGE